MANEPVYVDGGEKPNVKKIYYHNGLDIGGAEGLVDVVAATDGLVVCAGTTLTPGFEDTPARPRYDVVYLLDDRGWYYRYSHLQTIDPAITPGASVRKGQKIGVLGKEGGSGGWSHLHFEIKSRQPSGRWGTAGRLRLPLGGRLARAEARARGRRPAAPAHLGRRAGHARRRRVVEPIRAASRATSGPSSDGTTATGPQVEQTYDRPGAYSEILKVTDRQGHVDYDFAIVQVLDRSHPDQLPPTIHAAFMPTTGIKPGDPVTFKVRTFRTTDGEETWDFGDGTPTVTSHSDGNVKPARQGRLRRHDPPVRQAGPLPRPRRAGQPPRCQGCRKAARGRRRSESQVTGSKDRER